MPGDQVTTLRVLHLIKTAVGATWAVHQVRELVRLGIEVHVAVPSGPTATRLTEVGATVHDLQCDIAAYRPWAWPRLFMQLRALVRHTTPALVHSHFVGTTATMRLALHDQDLPRVFQVPGPLHLEHPLYARAELSLAGPQDHWIAACTWTREAYLQHGISPRRVSLSYYTTDLTRFVPSPYDGGLHRSLGIDPRIPLVGMVAHCYPPKRHLGQRRGLKGHEDFIDAIARCRQTGRQVIGVVVGGAWGDSAWYEREVHRYAERHCPDGIRFLGHRNDVPDLYRAFTLAVHPSLSENVGGALESSLMGVPTIATRVGGFPDLIQPGRTGWLVGPRNPTALAHAITDALDDLVLARQLAAQARTQALEQFSPERLGREVFDTYQRIVAGVLT
jgi:glycosyltransferase involved in cell wall biosynthesis